LKYNQFSGFIRFLDLGFYVTPRHKFIFKFFLQLISYWHCQDRTSPIRQLIILLRLVIPKIILTFFENKNPTPLGFCQNGGISKAEQNGKRYKVQGLVNCFTDGGDQRSGPFRDEERCA
jgi:hypothetical protein